LKAGRPGKRAAKEDKKKVEKPTPARARKRSMMDVQKLAGLTD
jgi:hypothetical protein